MFLVLRFMSILVACLLFTACSGGGGSGGGGTFASCPLREPVAGEILGF